jgi:hypothetical protein
MMQKEKLKSFLEEIKKEIAKRSEISASRHKSKAADFHLKRIYANHEVEFVWMRDEAEA